MKKQLWVWLVINALITHLSAQSINPYQAFGYEAKNKYVITNKPKGFEVVNTDTTVPAKTIVVSPHLGKLFVYDKADQAQVIDVNSNDKFRFLSVDPITNQYPELTPYQFASNTPIQAIDRDGLEAAQVMQAITAVSIYLNTPASYAERTGLAYQTNYNSSGVNLTAETYSGLTKGQYLLHSVGQSLVANVNNDLIMRMPHSPNLHVEIHTPTSKLTVPEVHVPESPTATTHVTVPEPAKSKTATWVEAGLVSQSLVDRYNKLNSKDRSFLPLTVAGKNVVKDINAEVNGGNMTCVSCGVPVIPAPKSKKGVSPAPNETHVDHVNRREEGGSGTPVNGDVNCQNCNVVIKH